MDRSNSPKIYKHLQWSPQTCTISNFQPSHAWWTM